MYTSDKKTLSRAAMRYALTAALCAAVSGVYECFSHGVVSAYMLCAFVPPLLLGCGGCAAAETFGRRHGEWSASLWALGVASLSVGCFVRGALEIYGTANPLTMVYPAAGLLLLLAGAVCCIAEV